ncbi:MAG: alpha/beta hydrolase [Cyclobacteriaceae bacterium]|nr:alpha/beta hydrolase [Cyclobacteriaceae bacterium]
MIKRILKWTVSILVGLVLVFLVYSSIRQMNYNSFIDNEFKPTGRFSDIGTNRIHFKYYDEGEITFVLLSGLGETLNTWHKIEQELATRGRVFMYDRSGLGHSEAGISPRSVDNLSTELNEVLKKEGIPGPYILIGHSAGGFLARYYAYKFPDKVEGLFLIDPYQEMSRAEFGEWPATYKLINWTLRNASWSGIPYLLLPDPPHPTYKTSKALRAFGQEAFAENISLQEFAAIRKDTMHLPVYVLTAEKSNPTYVALFKKWNQQILDTYSHEINKHILVDSKHHIHVEQPSRVLLELDQFISGIEESGRKPEYE